MNFLHRLIRSLIIPNNAGPNDPAIVIGPDIPAGLQAFYTAIGYPVVSAIIYRVNAAVYNYEALLSGSGVYAIGVAVGNVIAEAWQLNQSSDTVLIDIGLNSAYQLNFTTLGDGRAETVSVNNISLPQGLITRVISIVNSAAVGAEAVVLTTPQMSFKTGRVYEIRIEMEIQSSVINRCDLNVRVNNLAGALLFTIGKVNPIAASRDHVSAVGYIQRQAGTTLTNTALALTLTASAGTVTALGAAGTVRTFEVRDCGSIAQYGGTAAI